MPPGPLTPPERITGNHVTDVFESGADELDDWLQRFALVNDRSGNASVFVAAKDNVVVGYYALATAGVAKQAMPAELKKGGVPSDVPCLLLARLAVDRSEHNRGLGRGLLADAVRRAVRVSGEVGVRALIVHARDAQARAFYEHQAEFVESPTDPLHLMILLKRLRHDFGES